MFDFIEFPVDLTLIPRAAYAGCRRRVALEAFDPPSKFKVLPTS